MAQKSRSELQGLFQTGAKPSQQDFTDFIESTLNIKDGIENASLIIKKERKENGGADQTLLLKKAKNLKIVINFSEDTSVAPININIDLYELLLLLVDMSERIERLEGQQ